MTNATANKGKYADTRIMVDELNQLISDIQAIAPEISISELQRKSNLPSNDLNSIRHGNVSNIHRIREAVRFLKNTKHFLEKAEVKPVEVVKEQPRKTNKSQERILKIKQLTGWTYAKLGEELNVHYSAVNSWANGKYQPSKENGRKITELLTKIESGKEMEEAKTLIIKKDIEEPIEQEVIAIVESEKKYSFIERIKILFTGEA